MMTIVLAVVASALFGGGVALQQRPTAPLDPSLRGGPPWFRRALRQPAWLAGVAAEIAGFLVQIAALRHGPLVEVQPVIALSLLFTLVLAGRKPSERNPSKRNPSKRKPSKRKPSVPMGRREWIAAVAVVAGLVAFLVLAAPDEAARANVTAGTWIGLGGAAGGGMGAMLILGRRCSLQGRAVLFALAAGTGDATMAVLTKLLAGETDHGIHQILVSPVPYLLCGVGVAVFWLSQNAYHVGRPTVTLPIISVADPVLSSLLGVVIFGEVVHLGGLDGPVALASAAIMATGLVVLHRSPLLPGLVHTEGPGSSPHTATAPHTAPASPTATAAAAAAAAADQRVLSDVWRAPTSRAAMPNLDTKRETT